MTTHAEFYAEVETHAEITPRHRLFLEEYRTHRERHGGPFDVLDVGCGRTALLSGHIERADAYHGTDIKPRLDVEIERYRPLDLNEDGLSGAFDGKRFDVIFCGEVIEHVFSPDRLLRQLAGVMHDDSLLILSTPNLAYWVNRVLLVLGFNPLFVENSAEVMLGRRWPALGQGNPTQGHVRLFTNRAAEDLFRRESFRLMRTRSVPVWNLPGDRLICRLSNRLAPVNVFMLQKPLEAGR